jgi:predicted ArsR family transcriptional regulator
MLSKLFDRLDESIGAGANAAMIRAQLSTIREQVEAVEAQLQSAQTRIEELESQTQNQERDEQPDQLEDGAKKILQLLFNSGGIGFLEEIATALGLTESMAQYHMDALEGLVEIIGITPGGAKFALTAKGRSYVVKNKLV